MGKLLLFKLKPEPVDRFMPSADKDRVERVKESLNRINQLMAELKTMSDKGGRKHD